MRIAIFGGSFNPPHLGHIQAARAAARQLSAEKLIVIPTAKSPHKPEPPHSPQPEGRLSLTKLAFSDVTGAKVSDMEIKRGGKSFTADTLEELYSIYPEDEFFLLIGSDMLESFESWSCFESILSLAALGVFKRENEDTQKLSQICERLQRLYGAKTVIIDHKPIVISSTELRQLLARRQGNELLPEPVYAEIIKKRYYNAKPNLDWLRAAVLPYIKEKRVAHVLGCEQEAVRLAKHWGADPQLAAEAGLLHDITKKQDGESQLKLCGHYGIIADNDELKNTKLLHAKTGAAMAKDIFGVDEAVYKAILWHTTARENMNLLEKIIYIADYIEPNRIFDGVSELRRLAYEDLDKALILGLEMSLEDLEKQGISPHENSLKAYSWLRRTDL
jgi:nicotinate-nucleotide adenylyltransferase